jgi:hypothetical protein
MSKRREDVTVMKPRRVQGDPKKKILLGIDKDEHQVAGEQTQRLEVKTRRHDFLPELGRHPRSPGPPQRSLVRSPPPAGSRSP